MANPYLKKVSTNSTSNNNGTTFASTNSTPISKKITLMKAGTSLKATMPNLYLKKVDLSSTPKKPVVLKNQPVQAPLKNPYNKNLLHQKYPFCRDFL